jgi:aminoglycoside phosphotransferase (APT) family kinase protein
LIAHTDWSLRNVRVSGSDLLAVYDWDSLALLRESEAIALGAATWCKTGEPGDPTPTLEDVEAYIATYEAGRGKALTAVQHKAIRAAVVATLAYTARCEHSIDPHEQTWTTTRPQLRDAASRLF